MHLHRAEGVLSNSFHTLTPYFSDPLVDRYGSGSDFNIASSGDDLTGTIYVPFRRLGSGSNGSFCHVLLEGASSDVLRAGAILTRS